jgi:hypothetical protein
MTTQSRAEAQSQEGPAKRPYLTKRDIIGIVLGVPVSLLGLHLVTWPYHKLLYLVVGLTLQFISVGLFIPTSHYERKITRAIGLVALSLVIAGSVNCAFFVGFSLLAGPNDGSVLGLVVAATFLIASIFALSCTCVLVLKLKPKPAHAAVGITGGIAVGLVNALVVYLVYVQE